MLALRQERGHAQAISSRSFLVKVRGGVGPAVTKLLPHGRWLSGTLAPSDDGLDEHQVPSRRPFKGSHSNSGLWRRVCMNKRITFGLVLLLAPLAGLIV